MAKVVLLDEERRIRKYCGLASRSADDGYASVEMVTENSKQAEIETNHALFPRTREDDRIAQPNTERNITPGKPTLPIVCLPVIDTRKHGKYSLHGDIGFKLNRVSGLLIQPVPGSQAFSQQLGVFSLTVDEPIHLRTHVPEEEKVQRLFASGTEDDPELSIIWCRDGLRT